MYVRQLFVYNRFIFQLNKGELSYSEIRICVCLCGQLERNMYLKCGTSKIGRLWLSTHVAHRQV
jgi:hypothetical protein